MSNPYVMTPHPEDHSLPRGVRLANPGNIEKGEKWQGLAKDQPDERFCTFATASAGIRALAKILVNYQRLHGLFDIHSMISRWAPPGENDTNAYIAQVAAACGVSPTAALPFDAHGPDMLRRIVTAVIQRENGQQPYDEATILEACKEALG
ncbi:MAG TPA: structural protein [Terriglobia bacterium]|nr:structural protein [Terriglobia bacterium]